MTSEDITKVLLAFIATMGAISTAVIGVYLELLRRKAVVNDQKTDAAAHKADVAASAATASAVVGVETQKAINGRMDELIKAAYDKGYLEGKAAAAKERHS